MAVAGVSNECIEYDDDDNDRNENHENSIQIHVTNTDGIDNHLEEIRWEIFFIVCTIFFFIEHYSILFALIFQYGAYD